MVYKKYIKRGGKVFGPYYYKSKKVNGKVITEYVGGPDYKPNSSGNGFHPAAGVKSFLKKFSHPSENKSFSEKKLHPDKMDSDKKPLKASGPFYLAAGFLVALLLLSFVLVNVNFTGQVSSDIQTSYSVGESLSGTLSFNLKAGELIPADAKVSVVLGGETREYFLSELVDVNTASGMFYAENVGELGAGVGYGAAGSVRVYPNVSFQLKIVDEGEAEEINESAEEVEEPGEVVNGTEVETNVSVGVNETEVEVNETIVNETVVNETVANETEVETNVSVGVNETTEESEENESSEVAEETEEVVSEDAESEEQEQEVSKDEAKEEVKEEKQEQKEEVKEEKQEQKEEAKEEKEESKEEKKSEEGEEGVSVLTGQVVGGLSIYGVASKGNDFEQEMSKSKDADLVEGSVMANGKFIANESVKVKNKKESVVVSTNYYEDVYGFGEEYLSKKPTEFLEIDLSEFNLTVEEAGDLYVYLSYEGTTLAEQHEEIAVVEGANVTEVNESLINETEILNVTEFNETIINKTIANETIVNETILENATVAENVSTIQYGAVVGKPVRWKKVVKKNESVIRVEIPKQADNITIYRITNLSEEIEIGGNESSGGENVVNETTEESEINETAVNVTVGVNETISAVNESADVNETEEVNATNDKDNIQNGLLVNNSDNRATLERGNLMTGEVVRQKINANVIEGRVSAEIDLEERSVVADFFRKVFSRLTGRAVDVEETEESKEVVIEDEASDFEVEYVTPGPVVSENATAHGKRVVISSDVHYENILAYTTFDEPVPERMIKLYQIVNGTREEVEFVAYTAKEVGLNETVVAEIEVPVGKVNKSVEANVPSFITGNVVESLNVTEVNESIDSEIFSEDILEKVEQKVKEKTNQTEINETAEAERLVSYLEWVVPHLSNATYEIEIVILNVQSYPTVGGNWTVRFNTTGEANLTITAWNGTTWITEEEYNEMIENEENVTEDLVYLETRCGNESEPLEFEWVERNCSEPMNCSFNNETNETECDWIEQICYSAFFENYSCDNDTGYHTVKVLTAGDHWQLFEFGDQNATAKNWASYNLTDGVVGWWRLDDDTPVEGLANQEDGLINMTGNVLLMHFNNDSAYGENDTLAYDFSGNQNNGTMYASGSPAWNSTNYKLGAGAYEFDGYYDYVEIANPGNVLDGDNLTISAWVYIKDISSGGGYGRIVDRVYNGQFSFYVLDDTSDKLTWTISTDGGYVDRGSGSNVVISENEWFMATMVYDGSCVKTYKNGTLGDTYCSGFSGTLSDSTSLIRIGERVEVGLNRGFNGTIDEVMIFNRSLSDNEIYNLYLKQEGNYPQDYSGHGNNGTVYDVVWNSTDYQVGNGAYTFDGLGDYVEITVTQDKNSTSLWYKNSTFSSWVHVAYNDSAYFVNGVAGTPDEYPINFSGDEVKIGVNGSTYFNGTIDEVMVWNRALSASEVLDLFNALNSNINLTGLTIWDDTDDAQQTDWGTKFYANYSDALSKSAINGTDKWCEFWENSTGAWLFVNNMSFNETSKLYEMTDNCSVGTGSCCMQSGTYYWNASCFDLGAGYMNVSLEDQLNISHYPAVEFDSSTTANASTSTEVLVNVSASDSNDVYSLIDMDDSVVGWWRMEDDVSDGNVSDESGECYDEETKILTGGGWKLFSELNQNEEVATLNSETGELEWQTPTVYQVFDNSELGGEMYRIETDEGDLVVSEKHRVYSNLRSLNNSLVENTLISDCSLNAFSSDQIGVLLNDKDRAKYGSSLVESCGEILEASDRNFLYLDNSIDLISCLSNEIKNSNSEESILANLQTLCLSLDNSAKTYSGEISSQSRFSNSSIKYLLNEFCLKNEKSMLASIINDFGTADILSQSPCFSATRDFNELENSEICESVNSLLDNKSFATANCQRLMNCLTTLARADLNSLLSAEGALILNVSSSSMELNNNKDYLNLSNFGLEQITLTYSRFQNGGEIYFLDENNNPIKVNSISKVTNYSGKIYDVDVGNDIVLVRRTPELESVVNDLLEDEVFEVCSEFESLDEQVECVSAVEEKIASLSSDGDNELLMQKPDEINGVNVDDYYLDNDNLVDDSPDNYVNSLSDSRANERGNLINEKRNNAAVISRDENKTPKTRSVFTNCNNVNDNNYINVSINNDAEDVAVTLEVRDGLDTPCLHGHPGSNPGRDASAINIFEIPDATLQKLKEFDKLKNSLNGVWSGNSNNGSITGATQTTAGRFGKAMEFDGDMDYLLIDTEDLRFNSGSQDFSIAAWIKPNIANGHLIFDVRDTNDDGWRFHYGSADTLYLSIDTIDVISSDTIPTGEWTFVAGVIDRDGNGQVYINGVANGNPVAINSEVMSTTITPTVGAQSFDTSQNEFNGTIDEVLIFNRTLSADEVVMLYNATSALINFTDELSDGSHTFTGYAVDEAGNKNETETRDVTLDTTTPDISIAIPVNNTNSSNNALDVNYTVSDDSLDACWHSNDTMSANTSLGTGGVCANITSVVWADGQHNVTVWANDSTGTENSSSVTFTIDTTAPTLNITSPDNTTSHYSATIDFNVSVSDDSFAVEECYYSLDGAANVSMTQFNATWFNATYSGISHGTHNVTISCNDTLDNWGYATESDFDIVLLDLSINDVSYPAIIYSNATTILVNVSNENVAAEDVNVSCYFDGSIFDSNVTSVAADSSNVTTCIFTNTSQLNKWLNVSVDPENEHPESDETNNNWSALINVTELGTLDAYDLEDDSEDKSGWFGSEDEPLPNTTMTYFFANYTMDNSSGIITGATCNVSFGGGNEDGTQYNMSYNASATLYYHNRTFDYAGNYSWTTQCWKDSYEYLNSTGEERVRIPLFNQSSSGNTTEKVWINYNELANITVNLSETGIDTSNDGYNVSAVWVQIPIPNGTTVNRSLSGGGADGGIYNATYDVNGVLGDYLLTYYANLTNGFDVVVQNVQSNFSVQNTSITVNADSEANTTETVNVHGIIQRTNGSGFWDLPNNKFTIKLNNVLVSSDTYNYTDNNFSTGTADGDLNVSDVVQLNLTSEGQAFRYTGDYGTNDYQSDSEVQNYTSLGHTTTGTGRIFELDQMTSAIGNITYRFTAMTALYSANVLVKTQPGASDSGGNTSAWYSLDNSTWVAFNSSTASGANMTGTIPVDRDDDFYIRLVSDTNGLSNENPVVEFEVNYTNYNYSSLGVYTSDNITLPNVSYTVLKWSETLNNGDVNIQMREADVGGAFGAWSSNYTNNLNNDITSFTKPVLQFRAILEATNLSQTPVLSEVDIRYFNASTNSTGGYSYNVTIPTDSLGALPLEVEVSENSVTGILGSNSTDINVWAETSLPYAVTYDYSGDETNYSVAVNFTRADTGDLVNGTINITISNSSDMDSLTCAAEDQCVASWTVPSDFGYGNYTLNISGFNESAYYRNTTAGFYDYLEEKTTTGTVRSENATVSDFVYGSDYSFNWNVTLNNTGTASMTSPAVYYDTSDSDSDVIDVSEVTPCSRIYPNQSCNALVQITLDGTSASDSKYIHWKANWTDNNGSVQTIEYTTPGMFVIVNPVITMVVNTSSVNVSVEHESTGQFRYRVNSTGTDAVTGVNSTFYEGNTSAGFNLSSDWVVISPAYIAGINPGANEVVTVNVTVPNQTAPGNYSGRINITSTNAEQNRTMEVRVEVPTNASWHVTPSANMTYNESFALDTNGSFANYTLVNTGNVNLTINITYENVAGYDAIFRGAGGTALFERDWNGYNPTSVNVSKGENETITLFHKGSSDSLSDVRVDMVFYNETGAPTSYAVHEGFSIYEQPPAISNIWFVFNGEYVNLTEQNQNVTIKVRATDDTGLNYTRNATLNITYGGSESIINATNLCGTFGECTAGLPKLVANFSGNFTPTTSGLHQVYATVYDQADPVNSYTSGAYNFTIVGTTTLSVSQNVSSYTVTDVDSDSGQNFYVNYTANNTGSVNGYDANLTFSVNSNISTVSVYDFANFTSGQNKSANIQINVSALTPPDDYDLTATLSWKNPDNTVSTDSEVLTITVASNKSFVYSPSEINLTVEHGSINSSVLTINNTGNDVLSSVNLTCLSGTLCSAFTFGVNESVFNISANSSRQVNVSLTALAGTAAGDYSGVVNITEQNISEAFNIYATAPENWTWSLGTTSINTTKGAGTSGNIEAVNISNTGNVNITFNISSTNSSLISTNVSSLLVPLNSNRSFMVTYSAPDSAGNYLANISVANASATPSQDNITVNLTASELGIEIVSPTTASPATNVTAGDSLEIITNVTYGGGNVDSNVTFTVALDSGTCSGVSSDYQSGVGWNISCSAPDVADGILHNLTVNATHSSYGSKGATNSNAVSYRDVSYPWFNITRNNINVSQNMNVSFNVTDNVAVDSVWGYLTYPNSSVINLSFTSSGGLYVNDSFTLNDAGEYLVNYTANDTAGNLNSTEDWFEVYDNYVWSIRMVDYASGGVANANITLLRPNTTTVLKSNVTNASGDVSFTVNKRDYDVRVKISEDDVIIRSANLTNVTQSNISLNLYRIDGEDLSETIALYEPFIGISSNSTGFGSNPVTLNFNYTGYNYDVVSELGVVKCGSWNYSSRTCLGSWEVVTSSRNPDTTTVQGNSTGFSSYFLAENKCGNGVCEATYGETTTTCTDDCVTAQTGSSSSSSGGGGGGGGISSSQLKKIEEIIKSFIDVGGARVETTSIYKELFAGESTTVRVRLSNSVSSETTIGLSTEGDISTFVFFESSQIVLAGKESRDVLITVVAPKLVDPGNYDGDIVLTSGDESAKLPTTIRILSPEGKLLDVKIQPLTDSVEPGKILRLQTDLLNLGKTKRVDVQFDLQVLDVETGEVVARSEEAFAVETSLSTIKEVKIPEETPTGKYMIKATAYYSNVEQSMQASSIAYVNIRYGFFKRTLFGIPLYLYLLVVLFAGLVVGGFFYVRWIEYKKRRFKTKLDVSKLPHAGPNSAFVGKIAETGMRAFLDMNRMQTHTLIAGATGSGKTVAAQDMIEEALKHKKSVIVFDPTAQWTGFLRKCQDSKMLKRYRYFEMKEKDARAFEGSIKTITDPYELINLEKYMNRPGEITIFNVSRLTPKQIDIVVSSTIEQVFKSEPEESAELKTLLVYDEVHRLLPKFGGSGQGFVQLERGAREFRKWGIGLFLISQVLSDFVGEIKANIGTELQMRTRYEGDLERVNMKYGDDVLKSVVREQVGTGMLVNAEYNNGIPYFISFRPMLHSTKRLTNEELKKYEDYFDKIEDLDYQIAQLKKLNVDTLDIELEIKLAKSKIKSGQFQMADMYLETLLPKIESNWKKLGKEPMHLVKKKLTREEVLAGVKRAKEERAKYISEHKQQVVSVGERLSEIKKKIEDKKKTGGDTSQIEITLRALEDRIRPYNGKIPAKDAEGVNNELEDIEKKLGAVPENKAQETKKTVSKVIRKAEPKKVVKPAAKTAAETAARSEQSPLKKAETKVASAVDDFANALRGSRKKAGK